MHGWLDEDASINYELQYAIANYCFPHHWPNSTKRDQIRKDERIRMTFGIHPRLVNLEPSRKLEKHLKDLEILLDSRKLVAVGEFGIDTKDKPSPAELDKQIYVLEKLAVLANTKKLPVVIHCRADESNTKRCLNSLVSILPPDTHIHRHCFCGDIGEYETWKQAFPNIKFGVSPLLLNDNEHIRQLFSSMSLEDLLLETDAPYLKETGQKHSTPFLVQRIARKLANIQNSETDEVALVTSMNAIEVYNIQ